MGSTGRVHNPSRRVHVEGVRGAESILSMLCSGHVGMMLGTTGSKTHLGVVAGASTVVTDVALAELLGVSTLVGSVSALTALEARASKASLGRIADENRIL